MSKDKVDTENLKEKNALKVGSKVSQNTVERKRVTQKDPRSSLEIKNGSSKTSSSSTAKRTTKITSSSNNGAKTKVESRSVSRQSSIDTPSSSSHRTTDNIRSMQNRSKISNANVDMEIINSSITPRTTSRQSVRDNPKTKSVASKKPTSKEEKPSSRVSKEKYFPKKFSSQSTEPKSSSKKVVNGYKEEVPSANRISAKKEDKPQPSLSRERTLTKILSPEEVRVVKNRQQNQQEVKVSKKLERPTTSTIRREKPIEKVESETGESEMSEAPSLSGASTVKTGGYVTTKNQEEAVDDYEDDFESYESDFEEYESSATPTDINTDTSSTESEDRIELKAKPNSAEGEKEQKLDSGTYDLPELKHKQVLDRIKEAIEKENQELVNKYPTASSNLASLSDEGFDEKFSMSNGFINFNTKKQLKKNPKNKRGEELMNMIRLDSVSYNLFDMKAISYEEFIKSFGRSGTVQTSSQTGDDNLDADIQTDPIHFENKWTQYPIRIPKNEQNIPYNHFGVGKDPPNEEHNLKIDEKVNDFENTKKLENFVKYAGNLILTILESKNVEISKQSYSNTKSLPFSEGYFKLNVDYPFLNGREVKYVEYSKSFLLLTVHKSNTEVYMNADEQLLSRSLICIWSLLQPLQPQKILVASGEITKACFDKKYGYLVFAGIIDGSVCVWDLRESSTFHRSVYEEKLDQFFTMRCPTYTTTAIENEDSNPTEIIAIKALSNTADDNISKAQQDVISMQLCTLDELGRVTIWSAIQRQNLSNVITEDQGLVPWGTIVLVQSFTANMQEMNPNLKELHCYDLQCSDIDNNHLYIASNYGVLHCLTSGMKPKPKIYAAQTGASKSVCCLEMCPHSSVHFLAGSSDGCIRLHSRHYERALMNLRSIEENQNSQEKVEIIQWSQSRPCVFYVKDNNNFVHVWDLLSSDMYPIYSIPFKEEVTCIKLSPVQEGSQTYMAISTKKGSIYLHTINEKFGQASSEQFTLELKTFLNYVNRL